MNDGDGGDDRGGMNDDEGEQQVKEEMGEAWERVTKKRKSQMSNDELPAYFDSHLRGVGECPNPSCNCIAIIADRDVRDSVKKGSKYILFCLPFIDDGMAVVPEAVHMHVLCLLGIAPCS